MAPKSFLGLMMFYSRFMPHHSTVLAPLNNLLKKNVPWKWTKSEDAAFTAAKNATGTQSSCEKSKSQRTAESRGFSPGTPVSSHRES